MRERRELLRKIPTRVLIGTFGIVVAMLFASWPMIATWLIENVR